MAEPDEPDRAGMPPSDGRHLFAALGTPATLRARVVQPGPAPRIHGYAVDDDLARLHGFSAVVYLCATGSLPDDAQARRFERALVGLSPIHVGQAPAHAAVLCRTMGAGAGGVTATAAAALAEEARVVLEEHRALLAWLAGGSGPLPAAFVATPPDPRTAQLLFGMGLPQFADARPVAALLALLWSSGVVDAEQLAATWVLARLPCAVAEGLAATPGDVRDYPLFVPEFRYVPPPRL